MELWQVNSSGPISAGITVGVGSRSKAELKAAGHFSLHSTNRDDKQLIRRPGQIVIEKFTSGMLRNYSAIYVAVWRMTEDAGFDFRLNIDYHDHPELVFCFHQQRPFQLFIYDIEVVDREKRISACRSIEIGVAGEAPAQDRVS